MDDLFAMESFPEPDPMELLQEHQQHGLEESLDSLALGQQHQQHFTTSSEDPVLVRDPRILKNILQRQDHATADYFKTIQTDLKPHMRKIVSDWMLEVCEDQQCQPEVFHLAMNYMDRFLSTLKIAKSQFQLLGCVCMFLASKFKETCPLSTESLVVYTEHSVVTSELTQWELFVLDVLQWELSAVTAYSVLDHLLKCLSFSPKLLDANVVRKHSETLVALATTEHKFSQKSPALVAVACLGAALRGLNAQSLDSLLAQLQLTTGVQLDVIKACMNEIETSICHTVGGIGYYAETSKLQPSAPRSNSMTTPKMVIPQNHSTTIFDASGKAVASASTTPTETIEVATTFVY